MNPQFASMSDQEIDMMATQMEMMASNPQMMKSAMQMMGGMDHKEATRKVNQARIGFHLFQTQNQQLALLHAHVL